MQYDAEAKKYRDVASIKFYVDLPAEKVAKLIAMLIEKDVVVKHK
jgi:hypothetical protein